MAKLQDAGTSFNLIVTKNGYVAIQFDEKVKELILTAEQAKAVGIGFIEMGTRAEYVKEFGSEVYPSTIYPRVPARKM
jgi:hypothetical protein